MSAPEPAPAPLPQPDPSRVTLDRAVDRLLATADELERAQAAVDALRAKVDRFERTHPAEVAAPHTVETPAGSAPDETSSVRRVAGVITHTAVAFAVATVVLAIADPVLPRPAVPFFDTPAAASQIQHSTPPSP